MTKVAITVLVAIHLAATLWHGDAHTRLAIELPPAKTAFVMVVILVAPIVAAGLVWTRFVSIGLWVFVISMLGALLFGVYHHYLMVSNDNVGHLPAGNPEFHSQFISSAAVIAFLELASALYGAGCLYSRRGRSQAHGRK
jgi:NADPH:quinone reductase-like Zn-dependent oxidoreductase